MKTTTLLLQAISMTLLLSSNSFAQAPKECSGEIMVPSLNCITPNGPDVRLYITEFQTCVEEKIVELDRSILGMNVVSQNSIDDIHTISADNIAIKYAEKRILIDADDRVDNLSFLMPTDVTMTDNDTIIEMKITDKLAPNYEGAGKGDTHFKGSFKIIKSDGKIKTGTLMCFVNR